MLTRTDVVVVGAGVFGLSAALSLARAGLSVTVFEAESPGSGASGGPMGALAPHMPERWRPLNRFQLDALAAMPARMAALKAETGIDTGYRPTGRLTPLLTEQQRRRTEINAAAAHKQWGDAGRYCLLDRPPEGFADWLPAASCPFGVAHDTLSARLWPRAYISALAVAYRQMGGVLRTGMRVERIDPETAIVTVDGQTMAASHVVVASGWRSSALLPGKSICGSGVKGQAALLAASVPDGWPMIYRDGLFIVPHASGKVAVGSTSEKAWAHDSTDRLLDELLAKARALCPAIASAPVLERWSGIRPKAPGREPMVGRHPDHPRLIIATGGFKIGFAVAHLVGDAVACLVTGTDPVGTLPLEFDPAVHLGQ